MSCETPIYVNKSFVPCGRCSSCIKRNRSDWIFRLDQEAFYSNQSLFITLTYSDENLSYIDYEDDSIAVFEKRHLQLFFKRFRKNNPAVKFKYFAVSEYGEKSHRPHFHVLMFVKSVPLFDITVIQGAWSYGTAFVVPAYSGSLRYCTKDMLKRHKIDLPDEYQPCKFVSNGLGIDYVKIHRRNHQKRQFDTSSMLLTPLAGKPQKRVSRYYESKLFTSSQVHLLKLKLAHSKLFTSYSDIDRNSRINQSSYYEGVQQRLRNLESLRHKNKKL